MSREALPAGSSPRTRFAVLDGMRGLAAVFIILDHLTDVMKPPLFPGRYLAVDLFFLLSGFVIAHSYGDRLRAEMSVRDFMLQRLVRLYPLYALGLVLGLIAILPTLRFAGSNTWINLAIDTAAGALFLPNPSEFSIAEGAFSRLNGPSWSLSYELIANVLFALVVPHLSTRRLGVMIAGGAIAMAATVIHANTLALGWLLTESHVLNGLGRSIFGFFGGVAIYRVWQTGRFASLRPPGWLVLIALAVALALPGNGSWHGVVALLCAWIMFPGLILAGAQATTGPGLLLVCANLGAASYAFYILQVPIIGIIKHFFGYVVGMPLSALGWMGVALVVAVVYISALVADALFDIPLRRWLRARVQHLVRARSASARRPE